MKRCPICHRLGIEYNPFTGEEKCLWSNCSPRPRPNYKKFIKAIEKHHKNYPRTEDLY